MTDEDAQNYMEKHGVELRKVEWSREETSDVYGGTGRFQRSQ